jgi:hypothetical protein
MKTNYRIDWKAGMRLSDAIFNASDEFHIAQLMPLYTLMLRDGYGHLVEPRFRYEVDNEALSVIEMSCLALSASGRLVNIRFDHNERELFQALAMPASYEPFIVYVDASSSAHVSFVEKDIPYRDVDYQLVFKQESANYNNPDAVPVARFVYNQNWTMDTSFIPPCTSLKVHADLWNLGFAYTRSLNNLISALKGKVDSQMEIAVKALIPTLSMVKIEVEKGLDSITPKRLITIMQQVIYSIVELSELGTSYSVPEPEACKAYINDNYHSCKIVEMVNEGIRLTGLLIVMVGGFLPKPMVVETVHETPELANQAPFTRPLRERDANSKRMSFRDKK